MKLASPENFLYLLSIPLVFGLMYLAYKSRSNGLERLALNPTRLKIVPEKSPMIFWLRALLMFGVLFFLTLALVRPQWGKEMQWVERKGLDLMLVVDISKSMWATDIAPSRLTRSKHEISSFLEKLKGDRVGLMAFAGETQPLCPLSIDYGAVRLFLNALDPLTIKPGTDLGLAIERSLGSFQEVSKNSTKYQVMLVISDGEEHDPKAIEMAKKASEMGVTIYAVGVGSTEGVPIPLPGKQVQYLKDSEGRTVQTKLNEDLLKSIASESGGRYFHANGPEFQLERVIEDLEARERRDLEGQQFEQYKERFQIPLSLALLLLIVESFISVLYRRGKK
jgi:Ca-activated chloride channel family protein